MLSRLRSNYSNPPGGSGLIELMQACARLGWTQAMVADTNLCSAFAFYRAAQAEGIEPIYALDITDGTSKAVLIARNRTGYANLCQLLSRKNLHQHFSLLRDLPPLQRGIVTLCRDTTSLTTLSQRLNRGYLYAEIIRPGSFRHERQLVERARKLGIRTIASADVRYVDASHVPRLNMLNAIRSNSLLAHITPDPGCYGLPSPAVFKAWFNDMPDALRNSRTIGERCNVNPWSGRLIFPQVEGDSEARLRNAAEHGLANRYTAPDTTVRKRLEYEIRVVLEMGFADYFLVVAEIVDYARTLGSPVACRGSGAGSLLAYCLHISNVDPVRYHLPFERFLNTGREDAPDLDIDLCHLVRDKVIQHVFDRYGNDHVAMISTHIALQSRSAIRLCAKALGLSDRDIKTLQRHAADGSTNYQKLGRQATVALKAAQDLIGAPHHLSLHPGGIVITPDSISGHTPLIRSAKGVIASAYDKDGIEAAGLVKIDLLGNRALSSFGEAARLITSHSGKVLDPEQPPYADKKVLRLLLGGDTLGVNQLESPAMRRLLVQMKAQTPEGLMRALALIRPGAAGLGSKQQFIGYARGTEPTPRLDTRIAGVLGESYGLMIYEDDILQLLDVLAGMSAAQAQVFRKRLSKCRSDETRKALALDYFERTRTRDIPTHVALDAWAQMCKFNAYSFCRAHAASYGLMAWSNCWVKAHYPREFWVGALNHNQGMYAPWVYAEAVKQTGIPLLPPNANTSAQSFSVERDGIRCGLGLIAGLSGSAQRAILNTRPFTNFQDFIHRTHLGIHEQRALIRAGALDDFELNRPQMLALSARAKPLAELRQTMPALFDYCDAETPIPDMAPFSPSQRFADEWHHLGLSVGAHPITHAAGPPANNESTGPLLTVMEDKTVCLRGMLAACRRITTDNGKPMCFLTLSDEGGLFEVTVKPEVYKRSKHVVRNASFLRIIGTVINQHGCLSLQAEDISTIHS